MGHRSSVHVSSAIKYLDSIAGDVLTLGACQCANVLEFHLLPRSEGESEQILSRNPIKETDSIVTKVIVHVCSEVLLLSSKRFSVQLSLSFLLLTAAPECLYRFLNPCGSVLVSHVNL